AGDTAAGRISCLCRGGPGGPGRAARRGSPAGREPACCQPSPAAVVHTLVTDRARAAFGGFSYLFRTAGAACPATWARWRRVRWTGRAGLGTVWGHGGDRRGRAGRRLGTRRGRRRAGRRSAAHRPGGPAAPLLLWAQGPHRPPRDAAEQR